MKILNKVSVIVLAVAFVFSLTSSIKVLAYSSPATVNLGTAGNFVILTKTGISTTGTTKIVGDIGVSPAQATYITGFALTLPAASAFSTSALVTGKVYAPSYALPTPSNLTTAVSDMETAYTTAMGRASDVTELGAGNIGGLTLAPGVYKWGTGLLIPTDVTLSGSANDIWIFQIAQNLDISSAKNIVLAGGAQASNIFWVVAGQTTIGTGAVFNGNILDQTAIVLKTGAVLNGRALAQTAVTLDANAVTVPTSGGSTPAVPATPATPAAPSTSSPQTSSGSTSSNSSDQSTSATSVTPSTNAALQAQLNVLLATFQSLQAQRAAQQGSATPNANAFSNANANASFNRDLTVGMTGEDVKTLQTWLNAHGYTVASSSFGSSGNETTTFGELTRTALAKFQKSVGITPASGYFGAITRAYLSAHY
jgi:hypothetical protein